MLISPSSRHHLVVVPWLQVWTESLPNWMKLADCKEAVLGTVGGPPTLTSQVRPAPPRPAPLPSTWPLSARAAPHYERTDGRQPQYIQRDNIYRALRQDEYDVSRLDLSTAPASSVILHDMHFAVWVLHPGCRAPRASARTRTATGSRAGPGRAPRTTPAARASTARHSLPY